MWFNVIQFLASLINKREEITKEKREKLSKAFEKIAKLIDETLVDLENDIYPSGKCAAMEQLATDLLSLVRDYMEKEKLNELARQFYAASRLEHEYATRKSKDTITTLQQTSGKFQALAIIYSV